MTEENGDYQWFLTEPARETISRISDDLAKMGIEDVARGPIIGAILLSQAIAAASRPRPQFNMGPGGVISQ